MRKCAYYAYVAIAFNYRYSFLNKIVGDILFYFFLHFFFFLYCIITFFNKSASSVSVMVAVEFI